MEVCHCDFYDLLMMDGFISDQKLIRTYFQQLISGIEYLHSKGISHMDLKLENLLLGKDYKLKITDFDLSYMKSDILVPGVGTKHYRAPELKSKTCKNTEKADIYSAGIILFALYTGSLPYLEDEKVEEQDLYDTLLNWPQSYWNALRRVNKNWKITDPDFKELFLSMVKKDPNQRASLSEIKSSRWYNGPTYSDSELRSILDNILEGSLLN